MPEPEGSILHQQALTALGFFTGLTLTALVLILTDPGAFSRGFGSVAGTDYFQAIVAYVGALGAFSGLGIMCFLEVGGGLSARGSFVDKLGTVLFFITVFGFLGALPLLLLPFSPFAAELVLLIEIGLSSLYFAGRRIFPGHVRISGMRPP